MIKTDSGFLGVNKPAGISSFDVIRRLRKITGIRKIGHTGTLDPFATGLLICCIGAYTRLASYVEAQEKSYLATVKLGKKSSTGDPEGEITDTCPIPEGTIEWQELEQKALKLKELPIPVYSAVKVNGQRAYSLARKGENPVLPPRPTQISSFKFIGTGSDCMITSEDCITYRCTVSKGTYIRSLSQWLAEEIGTVGYTISLCRESIGAVSIEDATTLEDLNERDWRDHLLPTPKVLSSLQEIQLTDLEAGIVSNGGDIALSDSRISGKLALYFGDELCAIGIGKDGLIHPATVLR